MATFDSLPDGLALRFALMSIKLALCHPLLFRRCLLVFLPSLWRFPFRSLSPFLFPSHFLFPFPFPFLNPFLFLFLSWIGLPQ